MPITDRRLAIEDLRLEARLGVSEAERSRPQPILVSLEVELAPPHDDENDDFARVLDYDALLAATRACVAEAPRALQETLARAIVARAVAPYPQARACVVHVRKTQAHADVRAVGVRFTWRREA